MFPSLSLPRILISMLTLSLLLSALQQIKPFPTSKSGRPESQPISEETLALIKEKRRLSVYVPMGLSIYCDFHGKVITAQVVTY